MLQQKPYGPMPSLGRLTLVAVRPFGHLPTAEFLDVGLLERCQSDALLNQERIKRLAVDYVLTNCARRLTATSARLLKTFIVRPSVERIATRYTQALHTLGTHTPIWAKGGKGWCV